MCSGGFEGRSEVVIGRLVAEDVEQCQHSIVGLAKSHRAQIAETELGARGRAARGRVQHGGAALDAVHRIAHAGEQVGVAPVPLPSSKSRVPPGVHRFNRSRTSAASAA